MRAAAVSRAFRLWVTKRPPGIQVLFFVIGVRVLTPFCRIRALERPRLTCPALMYIVETECAKIARTLVSACEHFNFASRQSAQQALETNLVSLNLFATAITGCMAGDHWSCYGPSWSKILAQQARHLPSAGKSKAGSQPQAATGRPSI